MNNLEKVAWEKVEEGLAPDAVSNAQTSNLRGLGCGRDEYAQG